MPDRPGALASITTSLAAHGVDIVSLDVVSHEGASVVDDLVLSADSEDALRSAIAGFRPEVSVRILLGVWADPAVTMADGLLRVASAHSVEVARIAALNACTTVARADRAAWMCLTDSGRLEVAGATSEVPAIEADEPFDGRWALEQRKAAAFPARIGWAGAEFERAFGASWVSVVPVDAFDLIVIGRNQSIPFYRGELGRLVAFIRATGAIISAKLTERAPFRSLPVLTGAGQPPRIVTLSEV